MGKLYDLIQEHIDAQQYRPSERQVAGELGVTQTTLKNWREPKRLIDKEHLLAIARVTRNPYAVVLHALLSDIDYLDAAAAPLPAAQPTDGREVGDHDRPAAM